MIDAIKEYWLKGWARVKETVCRGWHWLMRMLTQNKLMLLTVAVLYIFRDKFVEWMIAFICPLTSKVDPNNIWVLVIIAASILLIYVINAKRLWKERELIVSRILTLGLLYLGYYIFVRTGKFEFYKIDSWSYNYVDCAWLLIAGIEALWLLKRLIVKCIPDGDAKSNPFLTDSPAKVDEMGREKYAKQMIYKIKAGQKGKDERFADGALTILLNEHYGVGKTSFMNQLYVIAKKERVTVCWCKPWLYEDTKTMIVNFIQVIKEELGEGDGLLQQMLSKYAQILASIKGYKMFAFLRYEGKSIETQFEEIKKRLREKRRPIIVLIDDVDRLQGKELLRMLQMVRNMGDFPYIYYIIAGDKEAIKGALEKERIQDPDEYLKKFFNLEICFPADDGQLINALKTGLDTILGRYEKTSDDVWMFIRNLRHGRVIFDNIRDIKRFLNVFDYALSNCKAETVAGKANANMLDEIRLQDLAGICMIQCIDSEFYRVLRDHNNRILEYKDWHLKVKSDFSKVFTDRYTKEWMDKVAAQVINGESNIPKERDELEDKVQTLSDLVKWSVPKKIEVIGELLEHLFPSSYSAESRIGVCQPTEYYKYFSAAYRKTELSNAETIGIMEMDEEAYAKEVRKIIDAKKIESFKNKLTWFLQTHTYDRLSALKKVMSAFTMENPIQSEEDSYLEVRFMQNYGASLWAVFRKREGELEIQSDTAWEKLRHWMITTDQYAQRIMALWMLAKHTEHHEMYIFGSRNNVIDCVLASEHQYVENVWAKDKYNPRVYRYVAFYREINSDISKYILAEVKRRKCNVGFLHHMLMYKNGELLWNESYIKAMVGTGSVFRIDGSEWRDIIPANWRDEFKNMTMENPLKQELIKKSRYLSSAMDYWRAEMELNERERLRMAYVEQKGHITAKQYTEQFEVSEGVARKELNKYVRLGYMTKVKRGTHIKYVVPTNEMIFEG